MAPKTPSRSRGKAKPSRPRRPLPSDRRFARADLSTFATELGGKRIIALLAKLGDESKAASAQALSLPRAKGITYRDEANVIVLRVLRDGFIEDLHSGYSSPLLRDPDCSRITQGEMKRLMIETSARLATWLRKRDRAFREGSDPRGYLTELVVTQGMFTNHWDRSALTAPVEEEADGEVRKCMKCQEGLYRTWKFCPACGAPR
jgi:hypothetical protein